MAQPQRKKPTPRRRRTTTKKQGSSRALAIILIMIVAIGAYAWWGGPKESQDSGSHSVTQKVTETINGAVDSVNHVAEDIGLKDKTTADKASATKKDAKGSSTSETANSDANTAKQSAVTTNSKKSNSTSRVASNVENRGSAKMAIVLDDFGYAYDIVETYNSMGIPLTYAVLPYEQYSTEVANAGAAAGQDIMVHLPMESESNVTPESTTIRTGMTDGEVKNTVNKALASIPHAIGVNNHQGSKATADSRVMADVMSVISSRGMFFLDSRTTAASVAQSTARQYGIATGANELFLDNSNAVADIEARLQQAANIAFDSSAKYVIVIGHARPNTARALQNMVAKLQAEGIEFVFVRSVLD